MKWVAVIFVSIALLAIGHFLGYKAGFHDRPPLSSKDVLLIQLSLDAGNYNSLKDGKVGLVEDNLRARVMGEVKACDLYRKEDPSFNSENKDLQLWESKGREIVKEAEEEMQKAAVPAAVK